MTKLLILFLFPLCAQSAPTVVATVNGHKITKEELEKAFLQNKMFISDKVATKEKVLIDLINRQIGIQNAKKEKLHENPVVKEKMEDVLFHAKISKDLEGKLKDLRVSDKEVKNYYSNYPEYRTAHILLRVPVTPTNDQEDAALKQILKIHQEVTQSPEKFAELANKYTQTNAAENGGDIGYQPKVRMAPEYFEAIHGKKVGHITKPIRTQLGYHIVKLLGVKPYKTIQKELYKKIIYDQKRNKIMDGYFASLRKNSKIKINKNLLK